MAAFCMKCGAPLTENDRFCKNCGEPVKAQPAPQPAPRPVYNTVPPTAAPDYSDSSTFSTASGQNLQYVVLQVTLKEKFLGTGSGNLTELEACINAQAAKGYRLHTITTSNGGSKGLMGGDRIQATMVFEKIN